MHNFYRTRIYPTQKNILTKKRKGKNIFQSAYFVGFSVFMSLVSLIDLFVPIAVTNTQAQTLVGDLEVLNCEKLSGWAWDSEAPNQAINVYIKNARTGEIIGQTIANKPRTDLTQKISGENKLHGFEWIIPEKLKNDRAQKFDLIAINIAKNIPDSEVVISYGSSLLCSSDSTPENSFSKEKSFGWIDNSICHNFRDVCWR